MTTERNSNKDRVFFALWPQAPVLAHLDNLANRTHQSVGGYRTARENLHLTLAFIGGVDRAQTERLIEIGDTLWPTGPDLPPLVIDRIDWWRHNRIVWCGGDLLPPWQASVATLRSRLAGDGFPVDSRPFVPHVTLTRKVRMQPRLPNLRAFDWPAVDIRLVVSRSVVGGVRYDAISDWRNDRH